MTQISIRGEIFQLLPERAVFHENSRTLLVADLHWGKPEVFQRFGIPVSSRVFDDDLLRLDEALRVTKAERLIVLGDLIHAQSGLTADLIARIAQWRETHPDLNIILARGNHDRGLVLPPEWRIEMRDDGIEEGEFYFAHEPPSAKSPLAKRFAWTGHIHPTIRLYGSGDALRLPCFAIGKTFSVLPAFSAFTGGQDIRSRDWRGIFAIADANVIEV